MGLTALFYPWGLILQAAALLHFVRRRPDTYWLWIILIGGGLGALVYIVAEVVPDVDLLRGPLNAFPRRRRIRELERIIIDNPAIGNQEELADLYLEEGQFPRARELYDKVISPHSDSLDPFYRRGLAELAMDDIPAALEDMQRVVAKDSKYDFHRAIGLLGTYTPGLVNPIGRKRRSRRQLRSQRCRRRTTTTRPFWPNSSGPPRQGTGPSGSSPRNQPCRAISAGENVHGSAKPPCCSSDCPRTESLRQSRSGDRPLAR